MTISNATDAVIGWSTGYAFANDKTKEDEIKQGKNYVMAAFFQSSQVGSVATLVNILADKIPQTPYRIIVKVLCNVVPIASIPFTLFAAYVKQDKYTAMANWWNARAYLPGSLPPTLGVYTSKVLSFFAEHTGDMLCVAMLVTSVALIVFESYFIGAGILVAVTYECASRMGLVSRKVALFVETYAPILSLTGLLARGTIFNQVVSVCLIPTYIFPSITQFIYQKVDKFIVTAGPKLEEMDAACTQNKQLNFTQITEILEGRDDQFEINPAHPSKWASEALPEDHNLDGFLTLFNGIDWENKYELIRLKLKEDPRFIDHLKTQFPEWINQELTDDAEGNRTLTNNGFNACLQGLAHNRGQTTEQFVIGWFREQMSEFVAILKGEKLAKGSQQDVDDAIQMSYKILPYLSAEDLNPRDLEDALSQLTVEAGKYCGRALKRILNELLGNALRHNRPVDNDPAIQYEQRILAALQEQRYHIVQGTYQEKIVTLFNVSHTISDDVHAFDIYRKSLCLGFYPLTSYERGGLEIPDFFNWKMFTPIRMDMYQQYANGIDQAIAEVGEEAFFMEYIVQQIHSNPQLSIEQRERLIERYQGLTGDGWNTEEINRRFHRLMFVMLGVLRKREQPTTSP